LGLVSNHPVYALLHVSAKVSLLQDIQRKVNVYLPEPG
jgi:hypothetical protein